MGEVTGIYICNCSNNISETVDTEQLAEKFSKKDGSYVVKTHNLLCSEGGVSFLAGEIKENGITRLVVGACSPRQHEHTFRKACESAGLNPYMMQMANLREMCAWTTEGKEAATAKAEKMLDAAVARVQKHCALEKKELEICPDAVVVGAGVAGMSAALQLEQKGRKVYLVERLPCIGGMTVRYEDVFPNLECAPCMLEPMMDEVLHSDNITVLTNSEVTDVKGFFGNYMVSVLKKARYVDPGACFGCDMCYDPCPVSVPNEFNENMNRRKAIFTPFPGALPNVPVIDPEHCLRFQGEDCTKCSESCGFAAINYEDSDEELEISAGGFVLATGFELFDCPAMRQYGYTENDNVITSLELERIISTTGPTEGKVEIGGSEPASAAIIHCVGGRSKETNNYCSGICCQNSLKLAHLLKDRLPDIAVEHFYTDWCLPGADAQRLYDRVTAEGAKFTRVGSADDLHVEKAGGALTVTGPDGALGEYDCVVLVPAIVPAAGADALEELFSVDRGPEGFFVVAHNRLSAAATNTEGVYVAGCAQGPKDIQASTMQGQAAAGGILSKLVPGEKVLLEAEVAVIDEDRCSGCLICNSLCPYKAINYDEDRKTSWINEVLCRGCGTCVAACPAGAIEHRHFNRDQILAEVAGVLS